MSDKEAKKIKRLKEFETWIESFKNSSHQEFIPNAAVILNDTYWTMIDTYVRPLITETTDEDVEANLSRYKIISASELAVVLVQPITHENEITERKLNASFAYYVAFTLLQGFNRGVRKETIKFLNDYKEEIDGVDKSLIQTIHQDHLTWLEILDPSASIPILSNAQTWRLFNLCLLSLDKKVNYNVEA